MSSESLTDHFEESCIAYVNSVITKTVYPSEYLHISISCRYDRKSTAYYKIVLKLCFIFSVLIFCHCHKSVYIHKNLKKNFGSVQPESWKKKKQFHLLTLQLLIVESDFSGKEVKLNSIKNLSFTRKFFYRLKKNTLERLMWHFWQNRFISSSLLDVFQRKIMKCITEIKNYVII